MTWGEYFRTRMPLTSALLNGEAVKKYVFSIQGMVFSRLVMWADSEKFCWLVQDEELEQSPKAEVLIEYKDGRKVEVPGKNIGECYEKLMKILS